MTQIMVLINNAIYIYLTYDLKKIMRETFNSFKAFPKNKKKDKII